MLMDAIGGLTHAQAGVDSIKKLGYPEYVLTIIGVAKLIGVAAIVQPQYPILREWGYAGFAINFVIAFLSWLLVGGWYGPLLPPIIMLLFMCLPYILWKKSETELD
ncbi:hypothetical protein FLA_1856 [Filimonas lacunae]|nr:hypothetical protein FLA_1856 [Filimonas lacunae]